MNWNCIILLYYFIYSLFYLQGIFLMYLYVGSIAVIISIYIWVLVDSCGSLGNGANGVDDAELGGTSLTRFGSLKRAHISRSRTASTSFYIRVGALREFLQLFQFVIMSLYERRKRKKNWNMNVFEQFSVWRLSFSMV